MSSGVSIWNFAMTRCCFTPSGRSRTSISLLAGKYDTSSYPGGAHSRLLLQPASSVSVVSLFP
jgi:hypothetical protein